jgi:hypothetical protein
MSEISRTGDVEPTELDQTQLRTQWSDDELRAIRTPEDAARLVGKVVKVGDVLGHGFRLLDRAGKDQLASAGLPVFFLSWAENESKNRIGQMFTTAYVVAGPDDQGRHHKFIINDSSQLGIHGQLQTVTATQGMSGGLVAPRGIRKDVFDYTDDDGNLIRDGGAAYRIVEDDE